MAYCLFQSLSKMAKVVQKQENNTAKILYHYGFIKMISTHELQKQNFSWQQFVVGNGIEKSKEELREEEILIITYNEDEMKNPKETSSKDPMGRIRTRSMEKIKNKKNSKEKTKFSPHMRENQENASKFKKDRQQKMMMNHNKFNMHTFILWK